VGEGIDLVSAGGRVEVGGALSGSSPATFDVETTVFTGSGPQTIPSDPSVFFYNNVTVTGDAVFETPAAPPLVISEDLLINGSGVADIGSARVEVFGDMMTDQSGVFRMVNGAALLEVHGNMVWHGISTAGALTAGEIHVRGPLFEQHGTNSAQSFAPSGSHRTTFMAAAAQTASFESPGATQSRFHLLGIDNSSLSGVTFISDAYVNGDVEIYNGDVSGAPGVTVTIAEYLDDEGVVCGGPCGDWLVDNTAFTGSPTKIPGTLQNVTFLGKTTLPNGLTVNGNLTVAGTGNLDLNANTVTVSGDAGTQDDGTVTMRDGRDVLTIQGNARFAGGNTFNGPNCSLPCLDAGQINLAGDLTQVGPETQSFHVNEGGTILNLNGTSPSVPQTITFANPAFSQSHLATLAVANVDAGIDLQSDVFVYDGLQASSVGTQTIKGNGNTLQVGALEVFDMTLDQVLLVWDTCPFGPPCPPPGIFEVFDSRSITRVRVQRSSCSISSTTFNPPLPKNFSGWLMPTPEMPFR
jgi:hypothetical protein